MMQGTVSKKFTSKKGTDCLEIAGQVYVCKNVDIRNVVPGDILSFEGHSFGDGKIWEMDSFKLIQAATRYPHQATSAPPPPPPVATNGVQQTAAPRASGVDLGAIYDAERPCVSNWGAELIKAGLINDPADLGIWVTAIKNVLR